jgi:predicted dienelactone hydrolase
MSDASIHVGYRALAAQDTVQGARVPVHVLYPTHATPAPQAFGPYAFDAARDAPLDGAQLARLPLVVVSHGTGGTPWAYRWLALPLARAGFVVALVEHPGNSRADNSLADTPANLANRPRHLRLAIDTVLADRELAAHVAGSEVGAARATAVGHSIGGYTALAAAGGRPLALPNQTPDGVAHPVDVERDPRITSVVLLAPALPWLMAPGALADVAVPVLARAAERDEIAQPAFIERVLDGLPSTARLDYAVVPNAGHFAFWGPVPAALAGPHFPPGLDPPGFDRTAYQAQLTDELVAFLRAR